MHRATPRHTRPVFGGRPACGRRCVIDPVSEMPARGTDRQRRPSMNIGAVPFSMTKLPVPKRRNSGGCMRCFSRPIPSVINFRYRGTRSSADCRPIAELSQRVLTGGLRSVVLGVAMPAVHVGPLDGVQSGHWPGEVWAGQLINTMVGPRSLAPSPPGAGRDGEGGSGSQG